MPGWLLAPPSPGGRGQRLPPLPEAPETEKRPSASFFPLASPVGFLKENDFTTDKMFVVLGQNRWRPLAEMAVLVVRPFWDPILGFSAHHSF